MSSGGISAHYRIKVSECIIEALGVYVTFSDKFPKLYARWGLMIQDPLFQVRDAIVQQLCHAVQQKNILSDHVFLLFLSAHEPEEEIKTKVSRKKQFMG
jgi:hypothetical protein